MDLDDGWNGIASASVFAPNSSTSRWAVSSNVGSSSHNGAPNPRTSGWHDQTHDIADGAAARHKTVACKYWLMGGCRRSAQECNFVHPVETFEETSGKVGWTGWPRAVYRSRRTISRTQLLGQGRRDIRNGQAERCQLVVTETRAASKGTVCRPRGRREADILHTLNVYDSVTPTTRRVW